MEKEDKRKKEDAAKLATNVATATSETTKAPAADPTEIQVAIGNEAIRTATTANESIASIKTILPDLDSKKDGPEQLTAEAQMDIPRPSIEVCYSRK